MASRAAGIAEVTERARQQERARAQVTAQVTVAVDGVVKMDIRRQRKIEWRGGSGVADGRTAAVGTGEAEAAGEAGEADSGAVKKRKRRTSVAKNAQRRRNHRKKQRR